MSGFYLDSNSSTCNICPPGCDQCANGQFCRDCADGFYIEVKNGVQTGNCLQCSSPCSECLTSASNCESCVTGYYLESAGKCKKCMDGCLACDGSGCNVCGVGYTAVTSQGTQICQKCPENCLQCKIKTNTNETTCMHCQYGYTKLNTGLCLKCGSNVATYGCEICGTDGSCNKCWQGLNFTDDGVCQTENYIEGQSVWTFVYVLIALSSVLMVLLSK